MYDVIIKNISNDRFHIFSSSKFFSRKMFSFLLKILKFRTFQCFANIQLNQFMELIQVATHRWRITSIKNIEIFRNLKPLLRHHQKFMHHNLNLIAMFADVSQHIFLSFGFSLQFDFQWGATFYDVNKLIKASTRDETRL